MPRVLAAAALLLLAGAALAADKIHLRSGSVVEGTIEAHDGDTIVVRTGSETLRIPQRLVDRVELGAKPAPGANGAKEPAARTPPATGPATSPATGVGTAPAADAKAAGAKTDGAKADCAKADGAKADGAKADRSAAPAPVAGAPAARTTAPNQMLLARLASESLQERSAALETVVAGWPATAGTLDAALRHADASVRRDAVSLLDRPEFGDTAPRIRTAVGDSDATVRAGAVRQVRNCGIKDVEPTLIKLLTSDSSVMVRLESLRTLEDVGTAKCLPSVFAAWAAESPDTETDRRRRYLRVLRKHTGEDAGEDRVACADAWRAAIARAAARKPGEKPAKPAVVESKAVKVAPDAASK